MTENKGDLISRSELKKAIMFKTGILEETWEQLYDSVLEEIDNAPTVNYPFYKELEKVVRRPQGEWVKVKEERMSVDMSGEIVTRYKCSKCGRVIATFPSKLADYYPFCHCGADMRKGDTDCMDEDAKQASIPYTYNAPQHDWKCGYPDITKGKGGTDE